MAISKHTGELEIDHERGVIYFHQADSITHQPTLLRICRLPAPIPADVEFIDITHKQGVSYKPYENS